LYQFDGNNGLGKKSIAGSITYIWISDQPVATALDFSGSNPWTGQLAFHSPPTANSILVEIGCSNNGTDFIVGGPEKLLGDGTQNIPTYSIYLLVIED
jgi:hypothetical protein